jgi:RNA polymerase sigma factor (sigma-70 family)
MLAQPLTKSKQNLICRTDTLEQLDVEQLLYPPTPENLVCYTKRIDPLIENIAAGCSKSFEEFYYRHYSLVKGTIRQLGFSDHLMAEDISQEVFAIVWKKRQSLIDVRSMGGFLFFIARNLIYSVRRKENLQQRYIKSKATAKNFTVQDAFDIDRLRKLYAEALSQLNDKQRNIYCMHFYDGFSSAQLARMLAINLNTAKNILVIAKKIVSDHIRKQYPG